MIRSQDGLLFCAVCLKVAQPTFLFYFLEKPAAMFIFKKSPCCDFHCRISDLQGHSNLILLLTDCFGFFESVVNILHCRRENPKINVYFNLAVNAWSIGSPSVFTFKWISLCGILSLYLISLLIAINTITPSGKFFSKDLWNLSSPLMAPSQFIETYCWHEIQSKGVLGQQIKSLLCVWYDVFLQLFFNIEFEWFRNHCILFLFRLWDSVCNAMCLLP